MRSDLSHKGRGGAELVASNDCKFVSHTLARIIGCARKQMSVPQGRDAFQLQSMLSAATQLYLLSLVAVVLFAMLTTCTRRFASASGLAGSFSLLLP